MKYKSNFVNISVLVKHPSKLPPGPAQFVIAGTKKALKTANLEASTIGDSDDLLLEVFVGFCSINWILDHGKMVRDEKPIHYLKKHSKLILIPFFWGQLSG